MSLSLIERLAAADPDTRSAYLDALPPEAVEALARRDWHTIARPEQLAPPGDWLAWFIKAGRGFGKTRSGGEWVKERCAALAGAGVDEPRAALVAPVLDDVRLTMVEGESGLLSILPPSMLRGGSVTDAWNRGPCELWLADGSFLKGYSSERPGKLRGPQHHVAWADEPARFRDASLGLLDDTTWSNLLFGLRLPPDPRLCITGTPANNALIKALVADPQIVTTGGSTYENLANLAPSFRRMVVDRYEGTRLGRQELHAEVLDDLGNLFQRGWFDMIDERPTDPGWRWMRAWDLAATEPNDANPDPDWTAGALVGVHADTRRWCIADVRRFRTSPGDRDDRMTDVARVDGLPKVAISEEPGSSGKSVIASFKRAWAGRWAVDGRRETGPKTARAEVWASAAEQGRVSIVRGDWVLDFLDEVEQFPYGAHDDQVDAVSLAWVALGERAPARTRSARDRVGAVPARVAVRSR